MIMELLLPLLDMEMSQETGELGQLLRLVSEDDESSVVDKNSRSESCRE